MPIMVERPKWILYKHTNNFELIKAVALDVKNRCAADISDTERHRMQDRLTALNFYKARNPEAAPLDSINHRINTLEFFMFGYEDKINGFKKFIFSPLGNLFLSHVEEPRKMTAIFIAMLFAIQFEHPANSTPECFQLYPFRLLFKLMLEPRLKCRLYNTEYAYIIPFIRTIDQEGYEKLVEKILAFRKLNNQTVIKLLKEDEHAYVNCVYEWQYYVQAVLKQVGILNVVEGENLVKLYHPSKTNSRSLPTGRYVKTGYVEINDIAKTFIEKMLEQYSAFDIPLKLDDPERMRIDIVKEIYSFYPQLLLEEIGEPTNALQMHLLELPNLIEKYANNPDNQTAYKFEDVLAEGFNVFANVEAKKIGGAGHTDIECLYKTRRKKFAVDAKSTENKLLGLNAGRLRGHREQIGGEYTIVITPRYVPAARRDIKNDPIVIILASTFSEYLYNYIYHDIRNMDYKDFDDIIVNHLGTDISKLISDMTMNKFATRD